MFVEVFKHNKNFLEIREIQEYIYIQIEVLSFALVGSWVISQHPKLYFLKIFKIQGPLSGSVG